MTKLYRSQRDKKILGLCGGIAESFQIDATILRLIVLVSIFFTGGATILIYFLAGLVIPVEPAVPGRWEASWRERKHEETVHRDRTKPDIDEMMKDVEKKAMQKEIEELKAKLAQYEKGDH